MVIFSKQQMSVNERTEKFFDESILPFFRSFATEDEVEEVVNVLIELLFQVEPEPADEPSDDGSCECSNCNEREKENMGKN